MILPLEKKPFAKFLKGPRVLLERSSPEKASILWKSILKDRELRGSSWPGIESEQEIFDYLKEVSTEIPGKEVVYHINVDSNYAGTFHIQDISHNSHQVEIGYGIEKTFEGFGYVSESIQLIEAELKLLGFKKVKIECSTKNHRSVILAERNGFSLEGTIRNDFVENGEFRDSALYAKFLTP